MSKITGNEPITASHKYFDENGESKECLGLTIRQEFAARAMQGILSNEEMIKGFSLMDLYRLNENWKDSAFSKSIIRCSVGMADALIEELNKEK